MYIQQSKSHENYETARPVVWSWSEIYEQINSPLEFENPIELHLIRHAETELNAAGLITGAQDTKLTPKGENQAILLGKKLDKYYDLAFCSNLQRSRKTLELALESKEIGINKIFIDERLAERSLGTLEGQKHHFVPAYAAGDLNYAPPGGESYGEVARRILSFLLQVASFAASKEVRKVLICGHMGTMRILAGIVEKRNDPAEVLALSFSNAEVFKLTWDELIIPAFLQNME